MTISSATGNQLVLKQLLQPDNTLVRPVNLIVEIYYQDLKIL